MLSKGNILTNKGTLVEEGISFEEVKKYNKENIPFLYKSRIKEWNYYSFLNDQNGFLITVANNTYMSYVSFSFVDFVAKKYITKTYLSIGSNNIHLPKSPLKGNIEINDHRYFISIKNQQDSTKIIAKFNHFVKKMDLTVSLNVTNKNKGNSIYILHPFKNKHHFYYNYKENLLIGDGYLKLGNKKTVFNGNGVFDFGRGIWPYKTEWFWISSSYVEKENSLSFNLGLGFGQAQQTENILYVNDIKYKLKDLDIIIPKNEKDKISYLDTRTLKSQDGDINLTFTPIINRHDKLNFAILSTSQNQVFGKFSGEIKTKEKVFKIQDQIGFIEHFKNRW